MSKAKTLLKIELLKDGLSMEDLQRLLKSKGYDYTLSSLNSKISRGTFSASFLLQCFEAMGHYNINLNDLIKRLQNCLPIIFLLAQTVLWSMN